METDSQLPEAGGVLLGQHEDYVTQVASIPCGSGQAGSDVLSTGIDGILRCHSVRFHEGTAATQQTVEVLKENFPLLAMATISNFGFTLVAVGGVGHKIHLFVRDNAKWTSLLVLSTRKPTTALLISSDSAPKKKSNHGVHWGVNIFAASQDKEIHRFTVMLGKDVKEDSTWVVTVMGAVTLSGHTDHVRSVAMAPAIEGGEHYLGSASDDGTVKVWKMSTLTEQSLCEGHRDDVLALSMDFYTPQTPIIVSSGKDRTIRVWGEGSSRASASTTCLATIQLPAIARCMATTKPREGEAYGDIVVGCGDGQVRQWRFSGRDRKGQTLEQPIVVVQADSKSARRKAMKNKRQGNAMVVDSPATTTTRKEERWELVKSVQVHRDSIASIALVGEGGDGQLAGEEELMVVTGANDGSVKLARL